MATLYDQLAEIAAANPDLLTHFQDDLHRHDRNALDGSAGAFAQIGNELIWVIRDYGTHLLRHSAVRDPINSHHEIAECILEKCFDGRKLVYHLRVTGQEKGGLSGTVRQISAEKALDMAREWDRTSKRQQDYVGLVI